jgi:hypothetical protein
MQRISISNFYHFPIFSPMTGDSKTLSSPSFKLVMKVNALSSDRKGVKQVSSDTSPKRGFWLAAVLYTVSHMLLN